jgi:hypothetical protein
MIQSRCALARAKAKEQVRLNAVDGQWCPLASNHIRVWAAGLQGYRSRASWLWGIIGECSSAGNRHVLNDC